MSSNLSIVTNPVGTPQGQPVTPVYLNPGNGQWRPAFTPGQAGNQHPSFQIMGPPAPVIFNPFAQSSSGAQHVITGQGPHIGTTPPTPGFETFPHPLLPHAQAVSRDQQPAQFTPVSHLRKLRTSRVEKTPKLTEAQKRRFRINDLLLGVKATDPVPQSKTSRLLNLPGELRNRIYHFCIQGDDQALLRKNVRMATLRPTTRNARARAIEYGDDEAEEKKKALARNTMRPAVGLTQVCRQLRSEFYPIYMECQEVAIDINALMDFMDTFFHLSTLTPEQYAKKDWPFKGNVTIALGDKIAPAEKKGLDIWPLLEIWANSIKIEAGFGHYNVRETAESRPEGEAKDLYRLFGRKVLRDRSCTPMNRLWRTTMRYRLLENVIVHRDPAPIMVPSVHSMATVQPVPGGSLRRVPAVQTAHLQAVQPYIHLIYRYDCMDTAMPIPGHVYLPPQEWLRERGFDDMQFFQIRISRSSPFKGKGDQPNQIHQA